MPLIQLLETSPDIILKYNIKQIVSSAGNGVLSDSSECSIELRHFLNNAPTDKLFEHARYCLTNGFDKSGYVLQDIINEFGRRLDYDVENGLFQGRSNEIGFDGLWYAPDGHAIIVETKTTDAYRIRLKSIADYRAKLIRNETITEKSSILIVVGRDDTGELEEQIRGSRYAWDARIISIEALMKLVELKIQSDAEETTEKIRSLLVPFEYTRLDNIIDVVFTTAKDVETAEDEIVEEEDKPQSYSSQQHTPKEILDSIRLKAIDEFAKQKNISLISHKRTQFWNSAKSLRAVCITSKKYKTGYYWYAFHPHQEKFLIEGQDSYLILSCLDHPYFYAVPFNVLKKILPHLHKTERTSKPYWHIHLQPKKGDDYQFLIPNQESLDLEPFRTRL